MESTFTKEEKLFLDKQVEFMEKCERGELVPYIYSDEIIISVIIPVYRAAATIKKAIRSIQNQKFKQLEIILYDDASPDNSYTIMEELQKEDKRINLYKNETNRGCFFTRLTASLLAKGKYIIYLDNDDMFTRDDIFDILYNEIESNNYDVVEFNGYSTHDYHLINKEKNIKSTSTFDKEIILTQPELSKLIIKKVDKDKVEIGDMYLWGKIIKADIMKKSINIIGKERYEQKVLFHDDDCVNYILFKNIQTFKFINIFGIFYYTNQESVTHSKRPFQTCFDVLFFFNFLMEFSQDDEKENIGLLFLDNWNYKVTDGLNDTNSSFAKDIIKKFLESHYIKDETKEKIKGKCKDLNIN